MKKLIFSVFFLFAMVSLAKADFTYTFPDDCSYVTVTNSLGVTSTYTMTDLNQLINALITERNLLARSAQKDDELITDNSSFKTVLTQCTPH